MEYGRYLKEVVQALESDQAFRKKLETAEVDDIKVSVEQFIFTRYFLCHYYYLYCYYDHLIVIIEVIFAHHYHYFDRL